jgi:hypothetical protein
MHPDLRIAWWPCVRILRRRRAVPPEARRARLAICFRMDLFQWFVLLPLPLLLTVCCINVAATCTSDLGCSLNGECAGDSCTCFDGWHGDECELLSLGPAPLGGAYGYKPNSSSWGAHVVKWKGQYNMFVSELWGGCGITSWRQNSHVVRATSDTPLGPYRYADTALPPEATCNHVLVNGSRIALYHQFTSGAGNGNLTKCDPNWQPPTSETWTPVKPHKVHFSDTGPAGQAHRGHGLSQSTRTAHSTLRRNSQQTRATAHSKALPRVAPLRRLLRLRARAVDPPKVIVERAIPGLHRRTT